MSTSSSTGTGDRRANVLSAGPSPPRDKDCGVEITRGYLLEVRRDAGQFRDHLGELLVECSQFGWHRCLRGTELESQRDQPLLRTVVQIAFDTTPRLVGGGHDPGTRRGELGVSLGVRDRRRHEIGEIRDPRLGVRRQRLGPRRADNRRTPHTAVDHDRHPNPGAQPQLADVLCRRTGRSVLIVAIHPGGATGCGAGQSLRQIRRQAKTAVQRQVWFRRIGGAAMNRPAPSSSKRNSVAWHTPRQRASSSAPAQNTSDGATPRATSVATRRSEACKSARTRSSSRLCSASTARALARCASVLATSATTRKMPITDQF